MPFNQWGRSIKKTLLSRSHYEDCPSKWDGPGTTSRSGLRRRQKMCRDKHIRYRDEFGSDKVVGVWRTREKQRWASSGEKKDESHFSVKGKKRGRVSRLVRLRRRELLLLNQIHYEGPKCFPRTLVSHNLEVALNHVTPPLTLNGNKSLCFWLSRCGSDQFECSNS